MDRRLDQTLRQARAAINLLVEDPAERRALYGHAVAMVTAESNAGAQLRRPGSGFIGPFQMNEQHAVAIRNQQESVDIHRILREQERLPPSQRNPDAQLLLNAGATRGPWMVSGRDMYQDQGVLGGVSTVVAARRASSAAETPITDLSASQVWIQHKLGWYGGAAIVRAAEENPNMPVGQVTIPEAGGQRINPAHIRSNFGVGTNTTVGSIIARTDAKFEARLHPDIISRLSPENQRLYAEATGIDAARVTAAARPAPQATTQVASTEQPSRETIIARQQALIAAGHDLGRADGVWGRRSQQADAAYKQATGRTIAEALQAQPQAPATQVAEVPAPPSVAQPAQQATPAQPQREVAQAMPVQSFEGAGDGRRQSTGRRHLDMAYDALGLTRELDRDVLRHQRGLAQATPQQEQEALRADVRAIQRELRDAGIRVGRVDGVVGERTMAALQTFRQQTGREPEAIQRLRQAATPDTRAVQAAIPKPEVAPPPSGELLTAQIMEDNRRLAAAQEAAREAKLRETGTREPTEASRAETQSPSSAQRAENTQHGKGLA